MCTRANGSLIVPLDFRTLVTTNGIVKYVTPVKLGKQDKDLEYIEVQQT